MTHVGMTLGRVVILACGLLGSVEHVNAQDLGESDLKKIAGTYSENEMRYKRDFAGKSFSAVLPFRSAKENMFFKGQYRVGFGRGGFTSDVDCTIDNTADVNRVTDWNKGDMIHVSGVVSDVTMGSVELKPCQMTK